MRAWCPLLHSVILHVVKEILDGGITKRMRSLAKDSHMRFVVARQPVSKMSGSAGEVAQARAIWELEAKVSKPKEPPVSKAPPPVKPVRGGAASNTKPVSEMSMSEYASFRQRQMRGEA